MEIGRYRYSSVDYIFKFKHLSGVLFASRGIYRERESEREREIEDPFDDIHQPTATTQR